MKKEKKNAKAKKEPVVDAEVNKEVEAEAAPEESAPKYKLDIPEDQIWTYQIEGLQPPHIGKPYKNAGVKKATVVITLVIAISLAIFLSVRATHTDEYQYEQLEDNTYELIRYSNPGSTEELRIDFVDEDPSKPITVLHEYALNCDEKITKIYIGPSIKQIEGKSFYYCRNLQEFDVDEENPYFCDIDGVLYTKDLKQVICYPIDRDAYLRAKFKYEEELWPNEEATEEEKATYEQYVKDVRTYVLPSSVETIGKLCFNYANLVDVYIPESVKKIDFMAFFKTEGLASVTTYQTDKPITETSEKAIALMKGTYKSLPENLEYIGSDAFSYNRDLSYVFIPSSVTYIGHHAFWDTCSKKDGEIKGVSSIHVESDENTFKDNTHLGDQWRPQYDFMLFKKSVGVDYSSVRE